MATIMHKSTAFTDSIFSSRVAPDGSLQTLAEVRLKGAIRVVHAAALPEGADRKAEAARIGRYAINTVLGYIERELEAQLKADLGVEG